MKKYNKVLALCLIGICAIGLGVVNNVNANVKNKMELNFMDEDVEISSQKFDNILQVEKNDLEKLSKEDKKGISEYIDSDNNLYCFSNEDKLVGFMRADYVDSISNMIKISEENAIKLAQIGIESLTEDVDKYSLTECKYNESTGYYHIVYNYCIGDIKTSDSMYFNISALGELIDFASADVGLYDNIDKCSKSIESIYDIAVRNLKTDVPNLKILTYDDIILNMDADGNMIYNAYLFTENEDSGEVLKTKVSIAY